MSYLVLARKYRPTDFSQVSGQEQVTRTLANGIKRNKIAHAFLFCGPRGVGKTSVARILSKALNCKDGPTPNPCCKCTNCREITEGSSLAVREIDGASHNSVDNVRDLIDSFRALPAPGYRYKVYIIDEVHMLSMSAFNALLKSLEEPPPHTVFILATTEVHKIPETVISRCQQHIFRALAVDSIITRLGFIAEKEKLKVEEGVLRMIANQADGSMRDAQSLLDKVQLFCDKNISVVEASRLLGAADKSKLFLLSEAILNKNARQSLEIVASCFETGIDTSLFLKDFVSHWRELLLSQIGGEALLLDTGVSKDHAERMGVQVKEVSKVRLQRLVQIAREGADSALRSNFPKYALEALVVRMALFDDLSEGKASSPSPQRGLNQSSTTQAGSLAIKKGEPQSAGITLGQKNIKEEKIQNRNLEKQEGENSYDFNSFVHFVSEQGARFIYEHLKRVAVVEFSNMLLHLKGSEFSINYLMRDAEKANVISLLEAYSNVKGWSVKFEIGPKKAGEDEGSILHIEKMKAQRQKEAKCQDISSHPKIQSLRKMFPGSEIENIKIKET
ncbi:MAG: DNA polymerase III subunit gamma/tau [SAR324 cluster bacterium]|uniref:DNA polymerase III subunit gamma/tau n=1 Tax=SAR324 cluster bacterium TaxID=2024889 RepID=A0A7X9FT17_9DELT|nr:DNA polymerase III subunit gamma/tau [SAR324 cluster bacterium]